MNHAEFLERGFTSLPLDELGPVAELRAGLTAKARELLDEHTQSDADIFNKFHQRDMDPAQLNEFRLALINHCTHELKASRVVFNALAPTIRGLIGPDIVVQKTANLVIHRPGDAETVPVHRDSPLNSPFEIIVWLPIVDAYATKSMYVLDRAKSKQALDLLGEDGDYEAFSQFSAENGENLEVPYGHAAVFWPGLIHGCHINVEEETRWTFNLRYKNLFAPAGSKGQSSFFELFELSPLTRIALEYEREAYGHD